MRADSEDTVQRGSSSVRRYVLKAFAARPTLSAGDSRFPLDQTILLVGRASEFSAALEDGLAGEGYRVRHALPGSTTRTLPDGRLEVAFSAIDAMPGLRRLLESSGESVGMILNIAGWTSETEHYSGSGCNESRELLELLRCFESDLKRASGAGGGRLVNLTTIDGQFGLEGGDRPPTGVAGTLGVAKSAAREWPEIRVQCIDLSPSLSFRSSVDRVLSELRTQDSPVEVGLTREGRWRLDLAEESVESPVELNLDAQSVFMVTGGADGITAEVTRALAERYPGHLVIVGRSPLPRPEADETRRIEDVEALRQFLIEDMRGDDVRPADIERRLERILKDRRIEGNLATLRQVCASVQYHALDVRDAAAFGDLIDGIYERQGRIDGVIHGAGIIEDKLIRDKERESFARVFDTKVTPALVLADHLKPEGLKFVVFFGSVAGRFGNSGQTDYSAANEELNKVAESLSRKWRAVHVVSINWGPWDHGMASRGLRPFFAAKGIRLIPVEQGVRCCLEELERGKDGPAEVVVTDSLPQIAGEPGPGSGQ